MKQSSILVAIAALALFGSNRLAAQSNPIVGTWKLIVAESKYNPGPAPQSTTRTYEAHGAGVTARIEGIAADGSRIAYGYTAEYDGKDNPIAGPGVPYGAETIALRRSGNFVEGTLKKGGRVVQTSKNVVSKDGKVMTIAAKGTSSSGRPVSNLTIWNKQ